MTKAPEPPKSTNTVSKDLPVGGNINPPIRERALRGGSITVIGFGISQIIRFCSNLILTRYLLPDAFGLVAMALTLQLLIFMVSDIGINASVIRSPKGADPDYVATAWVTQILRGVLITLFLIITALIVYALRQAGMFPESSVFNDWRLPWFILAVSLTSMIDCLRSMKLALCQREVRLGRMILLELGAQIISFVTLMIAIWNGLDAWSFIVGMVTLSIVFTIGTYLFLTGPNDKFQFTKDHFMEIFHFGKWLMLSSFLGFLCLRGDQFIFGLVMDRTEFGFYVIAMLWITVAITLNEKVIIQVAYTSFSELSRENPEKLKQFYQNFRLGLDLACVLIFAMIMLISDFVFSIFYPDDYGQVTYYLKLLSIIILILPYRLLNYLILSDGDSKTVFQILILPMIMMLLGTLAIYHYFGIKFAIIFTTLIFLFPVPFAFRKIRKIFPISLARELPMAVIALVTAGLFLRYM